VRASTGTFLAGVFFFSMRFRLLVGLVAVLFGSGYCALWEVEQSCHFE
jgi:hypothetical protein